MSKVYRLPDLKDAVSKDKSLPKSAPSPAVSDPDNPEHTGRHCLVCNGWFLYAYGRHFQGKDFHAGTCSKKCEDSYGEGVRYQACPDQAVQKPAAVHQLKKESFTPRPRSRK